MDDIVASCAADLRVLSPAADDHELESVATDLVDRWLTPDRSFHTLRHLAEILAALGRLAAVDEIDDRELVLCRVAAWFHHACGPIASPDEGAALALESLDRLGADLAVIERVTELVAATEDHSPGADRARAALMDADLWILAASEQRFDEHCAQLAAEHAHDEAYAEQRAARLRALVEREHLYATEHARRSWEPVARRQVERQLTRLAEA
ncbi:hypothetical protein [Arsenicicoccus dermatophilus]|uniref:HD domain-containing protein n=1 Tax=Arsenicicoccus dermatophilus TaxID=1076331 RepID=UPI001F4C6448|nr:hypothetical protein [Arsenicicoccus dermatophilus]MCH8612051.1 hypothetical protein [Arsenicicoccus dermatophilus]